jgi:hypothetical protein
MKKAQIIALIICGSFFVSCESMRTSTDTSQSSQSARQQDAARQNLSQSQRVITNSTGSPMPRY